MPKENTAVKDDPIVDVPTEVPVDVPVDDTTAPEPTEEATRDGILAAVNEALGEAPADDDDPTNGSDSPTDGSKKPTNGSDPDKPDADDPDKPEGDKPEGDEPDPDADPEPKPDAKTDPEAKPDAKDDKDAKKDDDLADLPEGVAEKTRERFETLRTKYTDLDTKYTELETVHNDMIKTIQSTGTNPDQFQLLLQYTTLVNSRDPADWQKAHDMMQVELQTIAKALGKEAPGVDPLEAHPDLKAELEAGDLSRERALEIASMRATSKATNANREHQQQETQQQNVRAQALRDLNTLGLELGKDPMFHVKQPILQQIAQLVVKNEPDPQKWSSHIKEAYAKIDVGSVAPPPPPKTPTPIRPGGSAPTGNSLHKEPGSVLEAMNMALDGM